MTECLLFIDRLGMKAALTQGTTAGQRHLSGFQNRLADALSACDPVDVAVDSDSGIALFENVHDAVLCGDRTFKLIFDAPKAIWMRGVIVGCPGVSSVDELVLKRRRGGVSVQSPAPALLEALVAEKSGFKGFRLRVQTSLLDASSRNALKTRVITEDPYDAVPAPSADVWRTKALRNAGAPGGDGFEDVLWMLDDEPAFNGRDDDLSYRLRRAGKIPAEVEHAAMTKVIFEEVRAIAGIVRR